MAHAYVYRGHPVARYDAIAAAEGEASTGNPRYQNVRNSGGLTAVLLRRG